VVGSPVLGGGWCVWKRVRGGEQQALGPTRVQTQPEPPQRCSPPPPWAAGGRGLLGGLRGAGDAPRAASPRVPLQGRPGASGMGMAAAGWPLGSTAARLGEGKPCLRPALPPTQPLRKSLLCSRGFFPPLLIPNQEIKGRQRLRLFPLCRELESSRRGGPCLSRQTQRRGMRPRWRGRDGAGAPRERRWGVPGAWLG